MTKSGVPIPNRRRFLVATAGLSVAGLALPAHAANLPGVSMATLRSSLSAADFGVLPGSVDDGNGRFAAMLEKAAGDDLPLFLPPGNYFVSNLTLPPRLRLTGVPGATRLLYRGDGHMFLAEDAGHIELTGLLFDGADRPIGDHARGLLDFRRTRHLVVENCLVIGSARNGIALEETGGRVDRSTVSGAAEAAIFSMDAAGLAITGNTTADCANGGILAHRSQSGPDGTLITGNRVERIGAANGGTGESGNGINIFRADGVIVANNHVADSAFSAIRANSASNVQIASNQCLRSGETAIYAEFAFSGAVINANVVDGAANGISIVNFDEGGRLGVCSANLVRNLSAKGPYPADPPGFGIGISVEADAAITGNVVEGAPLYGLKLGWGAFLRDVAATGNVIRQCGVGVAVSVADGAGAALISGNVVAGSLRGAVIGFAWENPVTGDLAAAGAEPSGKVTVSGNHVS